MLKVFAEGKGVVQGDRRGTVVRGSDQARRGQESMGSYYIRTGTSMLGATSRTRGRAASIRPGRGRQTFLAGGGRGTMAR